MTADYHLHSSFSGDSRTNPEDAVRAGIEKGLSLLCFTDHFDPDYPYAEVSMELDVPAYASEIRKLQALYQDQLEIRLIDIRIAWHPTPSRGVLTFLGQRLRLRRIPV